MFGLFKKKNESQKIVEENTMTEEEKQKIREKMNSLEKKLVENSDMGDTKTWNELGSLAFQIEEYETAIAWYEKSIAKNPELGKAHMDLMKLYNIMRRKAAGEKDSEKVQLYLSKMDELTAMSKDSMRKGKF